jgi:hypothetical protein
MLNVSISPEPFDPPGPPGRGLERIRAVLRLAGDFTVAELHTANRVDQMPVLANHVLANPQLAAPDHSADSEYQLGRVMPTQGLDVEPTADTLVRLGVFDHNIIVVDLVFGIQVSRRRGGPVPLLSSLARM